MIKKRPFFNGGFCGQHLPVRRRYVGHGVNCKSRFPQFPDDLEHFWITLQRVPGGLEGVFYIAGRDIEFLGDERVYLVFFKVTLFVFEPVKRAKNISEDLCRKWRLWGGRHPGKEDVPKVEYDGGIVLRTWIDVSNVHRSCGCNGI
jgi:hypothetical protein